VNRIFRIIIWFVFIFGGIGLSVYLDKYYIHIELLDNDWIHFPILGIGSMLFAFVLFNTGNVGRTLAKYGRKAKNLPRLQTDQLVITGVYSLMRHPMNQMLMIFPMAVALMIVSPSFVLIVAPLEILAMYIMIRTIEEPETRKKFGQAYDEYCAKTPRFCFRLECIKALMKDSDSKW